MNADNHWKPVPVVSSVVNTRFDQMNGLQRVTESIRYFFLCFERWISPSGQFREWMRHNARVGAWLLVLALLVVPIISLVLWQTSALLSMIFRHSVVLSILLLLMFRMCTAIFKR